MLVSDIINIAKYGELQQLAVKDDVTAVLSYINMGVLELYKRFRLGVKVEIVRTSSVVSVYTLTNSDIMKIETIYDADGRELTFPTVQDSEEYDIKALGHTTFLIKEPKEEDLAFVYTAAPVTLTSVDDEVPIPASMVEALLHYVGYRGHGSIDGMINTENNTHYMRFDKSCSLLLETGYGEAVELPRADTINKGFA